MGSQVLGSPFRVTFLLPNLRVIELKIDYLPGVPVRRTTLEGGLLLQAVLR
jgi:hypothetical protein